MTHLAADAVATTTVTVTGSRMRLSDMAASAQTLSSQSRAAAG